MRIGRTVKGLTLLEMLVVMVLVSLLSTLVIQGVGFFLGKYEIVRRVQHEASLGLLRQHWFVSTVQGMVPRFQENLRFSGDASSFQGLTIQPLAAEPGMPVRVRWFINQDGDFPVIAYAEEGDVEWNLLVVERAGLSFQYADADAQWHDRWPVSAASRQRIPRMVRLRAATGQTLWLVHLKLFPVPVQNYRDFT